MNKLTLLRLAEAGWNKTRKIDTSIIETKIRERGFKLSDMNREFLREYGNLIFELPSRRNDSINIVHFDTIKTLGKNMSIDSLDYLEDEYDFLSSGQFYPVGESDNGNLIILCTDNNAFYGYTDGCLIGYGKNVQEMLDCLIGENGKVIFFD